jgi:hypothetical protein
MSEKGNSSSIRFLSQDDLIKTETRDYTLRLYAEAMTIAAGKEAISLTFQNPSADLALEASPEEVRYTDVYPDTDLRVYDKGDGNGGYDFELAPGADPSKIRMKLDEGSISEINEKGELVIRKGDEEIRHTAPQSFQLIDGEALAVESRFALAEDYVGFELGEYDPAYALTIDPKVYRSMKTSNGAACICSSESFYFFSGTSASFDLTGGVLQGTGAFSTILHKTNSNGFGLLASTNGTAFWALANNGGPSYDIWGTTLFDNDTLVGPLLNGNSTVPFSVFAFATADGNTFYFLNDDGSGSPELLSGTLNASNAFSTTSLSANSNAPANVVDMGTADGSTFYFLVDDGSGTLASYSATLSGGSFSAVTLLNANSGIATNTRTMVAVNNSLELTSH